MVRTPPASPRNTRVPGRPEELGFSRGLGGEPCWGEGGAWPGDTMGGLLGMEPGLGE